MPHVIAVDPPPMPLRIASGPHPAPQLPLLAQTERPLLGLTLLVVEDSRFAADALRLLCQRAGARLRRAETRAAARAHLKVYRPDVVIVDVGLPDGRGDALIRELVLSPSRPKVVLGTSGASENRALALAAGADGFLEKPVESLSALCDGLRRHLPEYALPIGGAEPPVKADPLALQDDLTQMAMALQQNADGAYITGFLRGVARHAHDKPLEAAAIRAETCGVDGLRRLIEQRLRAVDTGFGPMASAPLTTQGRDATQPHTAERGAALSAALDPRPP